MNRLDLTLSADLYGEDYFADRHPGQDTLREKAYAQEISRIQSYISSGRVLDVGCGTGAFLHHFEEDSWEKYGIEISPYASKEAEKQGIRMIGYEYRPDFFDLIVMRGVIQHFDKPLWTIQACRNMLKPGGVFAFLATPNTNSPMYRFFNELPMLDPARNFVLFSDTMLRQILANLGFREICFEYPYLKSPYARPVSDHLKFFLRFFGLKSQFAFWRNMMECYARKPE